MYSSPRAILSLISFKYSLVILCSLRGSYWTNGGSNKGYLALFDVHVGNQKHIKTHDSSCYKLSKKVMDNEGYDSVYAHGGVDLRNDEFIIYNGKQCTIAYLIEIQN